MPAFGAYPRVVFSLACAGAAARYSIGDGRSASARVVAFVAVLVGARLYTIPNAGCASLACCPNLSELFSFSGGRRCRARQSRCDWRRRLWKNALPPLNLMVQQVRAILQERPNKPMNKTALRAARYGQPLDRLGCGHARCTDHRSPSSVASRCTSKL